MSKRQHLRDPNGHTHRCSGATVGDSHEDPLNNQGKQLKLIKNAKHELIHKPKKRAH
jgi:hypothetical protein